MRYERWRWYHPDTSWKDEVPSAPGLKAATEQPFAAVGVSALLEGLLAEFGEGILIELRLTGTEEIPAFELRGLDGLGDQRCAVLDFDDGSGMTRLACHTITAVRVVDPASPEDGEGAGTREPRRPRPGSDAGRESVEPDPH